MTFWFRRRIRHPFFPALNPTRAVAARGRASALCGAYAELERAAAQGVSAERAVFVLLDRTAPPFTSEQRDRLWKLFQTPVYAILTGHDGRAEAFECEVQSGFHVAGRVTAEAAVVCECGRAGPLLHSGEVHALRGKARLNAAPAEM
jgi:hypothetical protein